MVMYYRLTTEDVPKEKQKEMCHVVHIFLC